MNGIARALATLALLAPLAVSAEGGAGSQAPAADAVPAEIFTQVVQALNSKIDTVSAAVEELAAAAEVSREPVPAAPSTDRSERVRIEADRLMAEVQHRKELYRFIEILAVAVLGILALHVILGHLRKADQAQSARDPNHRGIRPQDIMNASGLSLIVFGTILVVIIADVDQQLTAAVGILGALAGYLFRGLHDARGSRAGDVPVAAASDPRPPPADR